MLVSLCCEASVVLLRGSWVHETSIRGDLTWRGREWGAVTTPATFKVGAQTRWRRAWRGLSPRTFQASEVRWGHGARQE